MKTTSKLLLGLVVGLGWLFWGKPATGAPPPPGTPFFETGIASWYGPRYYGKPTANGEIFTAQEMTAAHKTLPFNTMVRVTDLETGRSVVVRINDRGPFVTGRVIDLSEAAAAQFGILQKGLANVGLTVL